MARDYKNTATKAKAKPRPIGSWVSFISGLGIGLVCAVSVYFWRADLPLREPSARQTYWSEADDIMSSNGVDFEEQMARALPKREFDFYKILPEIEIKVPHWEISSPTANDKNEFKPGIYVLQVGSFKQYKDADRAKARLALRGISAKVHRVVINGQDVWYRVHVGPYTDVAKIRAMRSKLIESDNDFILLKIGDSGTL